MLYPSFNYLLMGEFTVIHGSEAIGTKEVTQGLRATGLKKDISDADANHRPGTNHYTRDGEEETNSAEALLPTFEGKVVAESPPPAERTHGVSNEKNTSMEAQEKVGGAVADANVENRTLLGSLEDASTSSETYYQPSETRSKNLNAKPSQSPWTVPTPRPEYDADSFEDPICDMFWKGIWTACAARNVGIIIFSIPSKSNVPPITKIHIRLRSSAVYFASYQTTSLLRGSITRTLSYIKSAF